MPLLKGCFGMKKEILFRLFRIVFVIVFVVLATTLRNNVQASYKKASQITEQVPNFVVTELNNQVDQSKGLKEEHSVNIKNISNTKQEVSFVLNNTNKNFPYNYMSYTILKNNKVVKEGIIKENKELYKDEISYGKNNSYTIVFNLSKETINTLGSISTSAQLQFI